MNTFFEVGQVVVVQTVPPQVLAEGEKFPETLDLFQKATGNTYIIRGFNHYGFAELWLDADGTENPSGTTHTIWVETRYLQSAED